MAGYFMLDYVSLVSPI